MPMATILGLIYHLLVFCYTVTTVLLDREMGREFSSFLLY